MDSISSIGKSFYQKVTVASSSGRIVFAGLLNSEKIYQQLSTMIIERHNNISSSFAEPVQSSDVTDQIRKYKALLDEGAITKEEYEEKKKTLLEKGV